MRAAKGERQLLITKRALLLLRRATATYYFTSLQVEQVLEQLAAPARVEACVLFFARVLDLEVHHAPARLAQLLPQPDQRLQYRSRIGAANILNPIQPDATYELDLRVPEDRSVATMLVVLAAEPGENWLDETYNGMPFDLGKEWEKSVPELGLVNFEFRTGPGAPTGVLPPVCLLASCESTTCVAGTADLRLRCDLARRHLMPGKDRWRALAPELIAPACVRMSPDEFDDTTDRSGLALDADGTLKPLRAVRAALLPRNLTLSHVELNATVAGVP